MYAKSWCVEIDSSTWGKYGRSECGEKGRESQEWFHMLPPSVNYVSFKEDDEK